MQDLTTMGERIGQLLKERGQTVAVAESSTGGLVSAALLAVPGASAYFLGGGIIYTRSARDALLAIGDDDMAGMRSSSEPYAQLAARTIRDRLGADWGLSETGAAGPTGNRYGDAAGHSCMAVAGRQAAVRTLETGSRDRQANMWAFAEATLALLEDCLGRDG